MLDSRITGIGVAEIFFSDAVLTVGRTYACYFPLLYASKCFAVLSFLKPGRLLPVLQGFAAEIVVGELGNVTCFIALTEERP